MFKLGDKVRWIDEVPETWRFIYTNEPMTVIGIWYHNGTIGSYAMKFGGMDISPGFIYELSYLFNTSNYYTQNYGIVNSIHQVHEKWLKHDT